MPASRRVTPLTLNRPKLTGASGQHTSTHSIFHSDNILLCNFSSPSSQQQKKSKSKMSPLQTITNALPSLGKARLLMNSADDVVIVSTVRTPLTKVCWARH